MKTPEEAVIYGGMAGEPYDPCYHAACDTTDNINDTVLDQMADAVAQSTWLWSHVRIPARPPTTETSGESSRLATNYAGHAVIA